MQECSVHLLICLLFPWVQCQRLKPVLSQCSQTGFVTVDDFMPCTLTCTSSIPMGAEYLYIQGSFFTLADTILYSLGAPILTVITKVWPRANQAVVTQIF